MSTEHIITFCTNLDQIGSRIKPKDLIAYIDNVAPYCVLSDEDNKSWFRDMVWKEVEHVMVHLIKAKYVMSIQTIKSNYENFLAEISCYRKGGV